MTNEDKPRFTVFFGSGFLCSGTGHGDSLEALVDLGEEGFTPLAWAPEVPFIYGGSKFGAQIRAESIAAGRVIKLIDGKYVPFGVAAEEKEEATADDKDEDYWRDAALAVGDDYDEGDADAAMIARDGATKPQAICSGCHGHPVTYCGTCGATCGKPTSTALPPLRSLTLSTDLEPASHQVEAAFGSAELVR
jgi:hypothetical protein